ncbi:hypothetical protein ACLOJK_014407 [Asimina triloba]
MEFEGVSLLSVFLVGILLMQAVPAYSTRRALFEHYVRTRAEEERKEKRAAQKAAIEGFKKLLEEASEDIDHRSDYQTFKRKWGNDPRFEALDRKDRELLFNEKVLPLKKAAEEKIQATRAAAISSFKSMLQEKEDINISSRWSRVGWTGTCDVHERDNKVKDSLRNDPRYRSVKHEDREVLFNEYISELKAAEEESERAEKVKREEQEKLKEREREMRKRKEREELEMERVRTKVRRKEAISSYQALLVETIKDPKASWTESKPKLEKDPQTRATNPDLDKADAEKLFREHVKVLYEMWTAIGSSAVLILLGCIGPEHLWGIGLILYSITVKAHPSFNEEGTSQLSYRFACHGPILPGSEPFVMLHENRNVVLQQIFSRCTNDYWTLLSEVVTAERASQVSDEGKTILTSWSEAKQLLKQDPRYSRMPRKDRESLWRRYAEEMQRKHKLESDLKEEKPHAEVRSRISSDSTRSSPPSRRLHSRR